MCEKTVYLVDQLTADSKVYHKACFRCHHCKGTLKVITIKIESFEHRDTWGTLLWHCSFMVFIVLFGFFYLILYVCTHAILCFVTSVLGYGSSYIWVLFEDYDHEDMNLYGVLGNILLCLMGWLCLLDDYCSDCEY